MMADGRAGRRFGFIWGSGARNHWFWYRLCPQRGTVLSFDVAGGFTRINDRRLERSTGNLLESEKERARFVSLHAAVQADVWRRSFLSASVLRLLKHKSPTWPFTRTVLVAG